jgi:hypothetical protein
MNQLFRWSSAPSYLEWLQAYPATIACKNNETLSHCGDLFHVRALLPPLTLFKTYYLTSLDLKIVLTTLHKREWGARTIVTGGRGPINCLSQQFLHAISIACKNNETLSHFGDLFHVRAPLPPLTMLKTYYLISFDLKIVLTTLHQGEEGQEPSLQEGQGQ